MDQIKSSSTVTPMIAAKPRDVSNTEPKIHASVDSTKLKQMLSSLKSKAE
jgi:hypothetical protein